MGVRRGVQGLLQVLGPVCEPGAGLGHAEVVARDGAAVGSDLLDGKKDPGGEGQGEQAAGPGPRRGDGAESGGGHAPSLGEPGRPMRVGW